MKRELCACYSSYNALRSGVVLCRNKQAAHDCVFLKQTSPFCLPLFSFYSSSFVRFSPLLRIISYCTTLGVGPARHLQAAVHHTNRPGGYFGHISLLQFRWMNLGLNYSPFPVIFFLIFSTFIPLVFSFSCFSNIYLISSLLILHLPLLYRRRACFCLTTIRTPTFSMRRARATETSATGSTSTTSLTFSPSASMPLKERGS